jgi:hypothetical protein
MSFTRALDEAQETSVHRALEAARARFHNLCAEGILPRRKTGTPINCDDIEIAIEALRGCEHTEMPTMHTFDMCRVVDTTPGAVIVAALALGFEVHSWYGETGFQPHAMINTRLLLTH